MKMQTEKGVERIMEINVLRFKKERKNSEGKG